MTTLETMPATGIARTMRTVEEAQPAKPVKWWAAVGVAFIALEAYVLAHWIISGNATRTPTGSTPVPGWMTVMAHTWEAAGVVALVWTIYHFVVRPWRRERRITVDGMLVLTFFTLFWQDPLLNYSQTFATYNSTFINFGNWAASLPGWLGPNGNLFAEPIIWTAPVYVYASMGGVLLANLVMRKAKQRRPSLGTPGLIGVALVFCMGFDFVIETVWMRLGIYTYAGAIDWLTLFSGHYYQFPIYEVVLAGGMFAAFACLRYFQNDKGQTVAERGIDEIQTSTRNKSWLRFLATVGIVNVLMLATYNLPMQWFGTHADPWPEDITSRSYLTNGLCGPGTTYSCPGPGVPIPRPDSLHLSPSGELVDPGAPAAG
ncbi:MAG TPA: spirocyclase AveC family protein [Acidimicrobiales bacterium]